MQTRNTYSYEDKTDLFGKTTIDEILKIIESYGVRPLFLCVTGSHMWNLATPESDLDVRGIFIKPTEVILSLYKGSDTIESANASGKDIDIQLYEVEKAFNLLQANNGNIVEMLLSPTKFFDSNEVEWSNMAESYLTKSLYYYYKGYYHSQRKRAAQNRGGKALAYTYRELLQGIWLMKHGELVHDFRKLKVQFELEFRKLPLLDLWLNRENWSRPVEDNELRLFENDWLELEDQLVFEVKHSRLLERFDGYSVLNEYLLDLRRKELK